MALRPAVVNLTERRDPVRWGEQSSEDIILREIGGLREQIVPKSRDEGGEVL